MGFPIKFNWVLQFDPDDAIELGRLYPFEKVGNRVFPLNTKIDLIGSNRTAIAKIKIKWFSNSHDKTYGEYEVLKVYSGQEKSVLSNYWVENE